MKYIVSFKENGERLDKAVALLNNELSRSFIAKLLKDGKILVNGKVEKPSFKVKENDEIFVEEIEDTKADIKEEIDKTEESLASLGFQDGYTDGYTDELREDGQYARVM